MTRKAVLLLYLAAAAGCQTAAMTDTNSPFYKIQGGSTLILNQELSIPAGQAHVRFQNGNIVGGVDEYSVNCRFNVRNLGPVTIRPERFVIRRAEAPEEWVLQPTVRRYYRVLYLQSNEQADVMNLTCQHWDDARGGRDVTVAQMREALGGYFAFEFAQ